MAEEQLRGVIDAIRTKLQAELDAHLGNLAQSHEQALHETRQRADADAEQRWSAKLDAIHAQWGTRLESEVAAARADVERALAEAVTRARSEAEQAAAHAAAQARRELEEAVAMERGRVEADLERARAERERAQADLQRAQADLERAHADRERAQAERQTAHEDLQRAHGERERTQEELQRAESDRERTQQDLQHARSDHQRAQEELLRAHEDRERAQEDLQRAHAERERARQDLVGAHEALERAQTELQRAQAEAEAIRAEASRELERTRQEHAREQASAANALEEARQAAASIPRDASELLISMRAIDDATSLTEALSAAVRGAALESPRAALFVVNGTVLQEWPVAGVPPVHAGPIRADGREAGFLGDVLRSGETVTLDGTNGQTAPMFAGLSAGRRAIAVPFVLDGRPVAVLYADEGSDGQPLASWLETVQILGRHATSVVTSLTAVRTAQAMGFIARRSIGATGGAAVADAPAGIATEDDVQGARRYARLLVSEIKLYNEGAVRVGREQRDLRMRLAEEISRARRLYEQRIGPSVPDRNTYFDQELVQTLAEGDASLFA
jgi:chemotaxis protein histidine kinase CheA